MPLAAAIGALAERVAASGVDVEVNVDLEPDRGPRETALHPDLDTAIYRIVQEALTNAGKHARAGRVAVDVRRNQGTILLTVHDDGRGFDSATVGGGFGLIGTRENAELLGGALRVKSSRWAGTTVLATLPIGCETAPREIELAHS